MLSLSIPRGGLGRLRFNHSLSPKMSQTVSGRFLNWLKIMLTVVGIAVFISAMFMPVLGVHVSSLWKSSNHSKPAAAAATPQPAVKPNSVHTAAATAKTCDTAQKNTVASFTACPSFILDYSNRNKGVAASNYFNVYTGLPVANEEAEVYTNQSKNLRVENGSLVLQALNDPQGGSRYTSARIDTKGKEDFLYGKIVVRASLPTGIGTWPAIWMLPSNPKYAGLSPASDTTRYLNDGEMDLAESIGLEPHLVYGVAHTVTYDNNGVDRTYFNTIMVPDNDKVFHDYTVEWTPTTLVFKIDNTPFFSYSKRPGATYTTWPYDQPFHLVINLALGGTWAGKDRAQFPVDGVDSSALPASLKIQNIRYYSYNGK